MAASRGGRRSTLVELHPRLRFAAVDLGASSIDIEVINGRLEPVAAYREAADIRSGPKAILHRVNELLAKARTDGAYERLDARRHRRAGPGQLPRRRAGRRRRSCRAGTAIPVRELLAREHGCPAVVDNDVNIMAIGERHGGVGALGRRLPVRQDRYRHRLRHPPRRRGLPRRGRLRRRHRAHPGRPARARSARAATPAAWRRCSAAPRWPATRWPRPGPGARRRWPSGWPPAATLTARDVADGAAEGDVDLHPADPRGRPPGRAGCWPRWSASPTRR